MSDPRVPAARVSRVLLLFLVAAAALVSIATPGRVSQFAGGYAVGVGTVLVLSRLGMEPGESTPPGEGDT